MYIKYYIFCFFVRNFIPCWPVLGWKVWKNRNNYINFYSMYINIYSLFYLPGHHRLPPNMTKSSNMDCGTIHASLHIVKHSQALIDTTNNKSPDVLKKKCSGASKHKRKGVGGPKPPVGVVPPPPSPPSKQVDTTINKGLLLLLSCF